MVVASLPPALGNIHLLLLHLPIGLAAAAVLLEIWTWRDVAGRRLMEKILAANAILAVLTAAAGLVLATQGDYAETALGRHRWAGVACAFLAVLAWWLRARVGVVSGRVGLGLLAGATAVAGHLGATLTHGDGLLAWSDAPPMTAEEGAVVVSDVHPLLVKHCVECHGAEKQKGRLRLDTLAAATRAGRSGERAVTPGDAAASEIMRRINLPRADEEAMPPGDRTPLGAEERAELAAWVAGLASR